MVDDGKKLKIKNEKPNSFFEKKILFILSMLKLTLGYGISSLIRNLRREETKAYGKGTIPNPYKWLTRQGI